VEAKGSVKRHLIESRREEVEGEGEQEEAQAGHAGDSGMACTQ